MCRGVDKLDHIKETNLNLKLTKIYINLYQCKGEVNEKQNNIILKSGK